jgi:hypothetical protein
MDLNFRNDNKTLDIYQPSRVDNFKRAGGTFEISRLLSNAP